MLINEAAKQCGITKKAVQYTCNETFEPIV